MARPGARPPPSPLPIDPWLERIVELTARHRRLIVVAEPGAGKSTRIAPALTDPGPVLLLQPRRIAARSLARRIADERGWTAGREVGWQVRFERHFTASTRVLVATEGILTARLCADPLLSDFATVVLDEFHERSLHGDVALALTRQALLARDDLRLVVTSATLDAAPLAAFLDDGPGCPVLEVPGRPHPVEIAWLPGASAAEGIRDALEALPGDVLAFLPGRAEIRRAASALSGLDRTVEVHELFGAMDPDRQDAALRPGHRRKVILATNVAETSLTVEGVRSVVDTGLHRVPRFDPSIELDRLEVERIPADSAAQRAGRAGRLGPGRALRLWDPRETLRPHREPEIARVDLGSTLLDLLAWGGNPRTFEWFEPPSTEAVDHALSVLRLLGALVPGDPPRLSRLGLTLSRFPLSPRLARLVVEGGGSAPAVRLAALLGEGSRAAGAIGLSGAATSPSDALVLLDRFDRAPEAVVRAARELASRLEGPVGSAPEDGPDPGPGAAREARHGGPEPDPSGRDAAETRLRRALFVAYPDRLARRRAPGSDRFLLASGHGAVLDPASTVRGHEFLVALDVEARRGEEARIRLASGVEEAWIEPERIEVEHFFDPARGAVRAREVESWRSLRLSERPTTPVPEEAERLLVAECLARFDEFVPESERARLAFAALEVDRAELVARACRGRIELPRLSLPALLSPAEKHRLDRDAPRELTLPSGRATRLEYRDDGSVVATAKLQELFGLAETPRLGPRREPVVFSLVSPGGRPVQTTRDLRSFWERTYPEVRKELRGRYPRHPWPEDPWTAPPTARAKPRPRRD